MNQTPIRGISSMATRALLAELTGAFTAATGQPVQIESVGGVDAARRVAAGEAFDLVVLASDAIDRLITAGHLAPGRVDLVRSAVAVAVPQGQPVPDLGNEAALRCAVMKAPTIGYSTGPSGVALQALFARWGLSDELARRTVQAPPGVPVASLVAQGQVALGFQQLSEMQDVPGITLAGTLPADVAIVTTFSAGVPAGGLPQVQALLDHLNSTAAAEVKRRHGMDPA
ncbi:substrate-binding domain-containing protein [Hydrogenophaga sp. IBVHS2]|uniref:substrate-binding domain-containing protein n=1 Tax=Hydrogenophaga sp. IBVHS2 TaxID=1985170 RepID=UPI000A2DD1E9|nr:substrate-binding domain-containing protein [Hydrogenophaga sp. IBVHS2]OSZ67782.1 molybdenum ABC transporter substrate-binding protein [Hydrogenophaga sp. IBVHS2]